MTNFGNLPFEKLIAYQEARKLLEAMREAAISEGRLRDQALRAATSRGCRRRLSDYDCGVAPRGCEMCSTVLATTSEIDLIEKVPGERELRLYLEVDRGDWLLPRAVWLLQEKLNAYASFILDGKMKEMYPWADPRAVRIVLRSRGQAPADALRLVELVRDTLAKEGPQLSFEQAT